MIDTSTFEYADSRWQDLYRHLKKKGYDVYSPGIKVGECTAAYLVVKNNGGSKHNSFSTSVDTYDIMCYVPKQAYSSLEPLVQSVKEAMKELDPLFKWNGADTGSYYDDSVQAHMYTITYKNYKKL